MSDEEGHNRFVEIRWSDNGGQPYCPHCGSVALYTYKVRRIWKCKACTKQFSVTSGTIFASRKLPVRDYLLAIALLANCAKGMSALQLGRDLDVQYRTAFVLCHKLREALASEMANETVGCRSAPNTDPPKARPSAKPSGATLRCAPPALALHRHNLEGGQLFDADPGQ